LSLFLRLPQPGGPGSCIYFPQEQGSQVILPGIGLGSLYYTHENKYLIYPRSNQLHKREKLKGGQKRDLIPDMIGNYHKLNLNFRFSFGLLEITQTL
jgi:hypothetical protein